MEGSKSPLEVINDGFNSTRKMVRVAVAEQHGFKPIGQDDGEGDDQFLREVVSAVDELDDDASLEALGFDAGAHVRIRCRDLESAVRRSRAGAAGAVRHPNEKRHAAGER